MALGNLSRLDGLQPYVREWAIITLKVMQLQTGGVLGRDGNVTGGIMPTVTSGYRDLDHQRQLRDLWVKSGKNPHPVRYAGQTVYPANAPGDSAHNWGLAWDSDVPDQYMPLWRDVRRYVGWVLSEPAGKDDVHAEWPGWRQLVKEAGFQV